jgi:two-component system, sensor histidine kinase and response regulator
MDGIELVTRIREDPALTDMRLVLLTSSGLPADRSRELRGVAHLMKPIARSHLLEAIQGNHVPERRTAIEPCGVRLRVLVAEDNAVNRKVAVRLLEKRGHAVAAVEDGRQVLAALDRESFDLILMDVQMPGMDGFEATAAIRARETTAGSGHVPIVALTAHAMKGDRERCLAAGMDAYVAKPVEADELFATIERLGPGPQPARGESRADDPVIAVFDRDAILRRVGADPDLLLELVSVFQSESVELLHDIRRAVSRRDGAALQRAAHSLKGALTTLAASAASQAALRLESIGREGDLGHVDAAWSALQHEMKRLQAELCGLDRAIAS